MVARLKQQVQELKDELAMATGEERTDELTDEERAKYVTHTKRDSLDHVCYILMSSQLSITTGVKS